MRTRQTICTLAALGLFILAAGLIEKHADWSLVLVAAMIVPVVIGRLDKKRVTCADIERRCRHGKN